MTRELSSEEKRRTFIRATSGMSGAAERWKERAAKGMSDEQLAAALAYELGIEGGASSRKDVPAYHVKGAGLQIWISWDFPRCHQEKPTFKGSDTVAMARQVYGIRNPEDKQMDLFGGP